MNAPPRPLCIYHGNCADGFTAAWAVWKKYYDKIAFHAGVYQDPPPDVAGRDVIMVDFSYKRAVVEDMQRRAASLTILDHHATAIEDLDGIEGDEARNPACPTRVVFDIARSGAGIAWDFMHPARPRPKIIDYVEDRDLWRFKLEDSRAIAANMFSYAYTFKNWDDIAFRLEDPKFRFAFAQAGKAIERKHAKDVAELVATCKRRIRIAGVEVWAASLPYTLTSDAAHLMARGEGGQCEPFAACYWDTPAGRTFSLRSTDHGADVSMIAAQYGGGGHKHAAGFRVPHAQVFDFELQQEEAQ